MTKAGGKNKNSKDTQSGETSVYKHDQETVQRPDVGVEAQFANKKPPKTYRYDSCLAPERRADRPGPARSRTLGS